MDNQIIKAIEEINKKYGAGKQKIGVATEILSKRMRIPTGCFALDAIISGGIPKGVVTELAGSPGSGKTTLSLYTIAQAQKLDPSTVQVYIAAEGPLPPNSIKLAKVDPNRLIVFEPFEYAEKAMDALRELLVRVKDNIDVIVVDSVAAFAPYMEVESSQRSGMEAQTVGVLARVMDKFYRVFIGTGLFENAAVIAINQFRQQVSTVPLPPTVKGGYSSQYYPKLRIWLTTSPSKRLKKSDVQGLESIPGLPDLSIYGKDDAVGHEVDASVIKDNTGGRPGRRCTYRVIYDFGYDNFHPIVHYAEQLGIVVRRGAYYQYGDLRVQGLYPFIAQCIATGRWTEIVQSVRDRLFSSDEPASVPTVSTATETEPPFVREDETLLTTFEEELDE